MYSYHNYCSLDEEISIVFSQDWMREQILVTSLIKINRMIIVFIWKQEAN